jgi:hypothetical protein
VELAVFLIVCHPVVVAAVHKDRLLAQRAGFRRRSRPTQTARVAVEEALATPLMAMLNVVAAQAAPRQETLVLLAAVEVRHTPHQAAVAAGEAGPQLPARP